MNIPAETTRAVTYKSPHINDVQNNNSTVYVRMEGDSMSSTIEAGELLALERCAVVTRDGIYAFTREWLGKEVIFIKRIRRLPHESLYIISDNKHYEDFILNKDEQKDLNVIGRVVGSMQIKRFL